MLTPYLAAASARSARTPSENDIYMPLASKLRAHHHLPLVTYEAIMATYEEEGGINGSGSDRPVSLFVEKEVGGGGGRRSVRHLALKELWGRGPSPLFRPKGLRTPLATIL